MIAACICSVVGEFIGLILQSFFAKEMIYISTISMLFAYFIMFFIMVLPNMKDYRISLLIYSMTVFFNVLGIDWLYSIYEDFAYITIRAIIFQVLSIILLFMFVKKREDVNIYIAITVLSSVGSAILNFIHSRKYVSWFQKVEKIELTKHLKAIFIIFGMSVASKIYLNMDSLMIHFIKSDHDVGLYSAAIKINTVLVTIINALSGVMLPRLSIYIKQNNRKEFMKLINLSMQYILFITIPVIVGLSIISSDVIVLLSGRDFIDASFTMKIMLPNLFCSIINGFIVYQIFVPFGKEKWALIATISGTISNFILNALLIPKFSQNGAAMATVITEFIVFMFCYNFSKKIIDIKSVFKGMWQYLMAASSFLLSIVIIKSINIKGDIITILFQIIVGGCLYIIILLLLKNPFIYSVILLLKSRRK